MKLDSSGSKSCLTSGLRAVSGSAEPRVVPWVPDGQRGVICPRNHPFLQRRWLTSGFGDISHGGYEDPMSNTLRLGKIPQVRCRSIAVTAGNKFGSWSDPLPIVASNTCTTPMAICIGRNDGLMCQGTNSWQLTFQPLPHRHGRRGLSGWGDLFVPPVTTLESSPRNLPPPKKNRKHECGLKVFSIKRAWETLSSPLTLYWFHVVSIGLWRCPTMGVPASPSV